MPNPCGHHYCREAYPNQRRWKVEPAGFGSWAVRSTAGRQANDQWHESGSPIPVWAELGNAAFTSVWVPERINPMCVRCKACGNMSDYDKNAAQCECGLPLPEAPAYF